MQRAIAAEEKVFSSHAEAKDLSDNPEYVRQNRRHFLLKPEIKLL
jgi:hypothetical protein